MPYIYTHTYIRACKSNPQLLVIYYAGKQRVHACGLLAHWSVAIGKAFASSTISPPRIMCTLEHCNRKWALYLPLSLPRYNTRFLGALLIEPSSNYGYYRDVTREGERQVQLYTGYRHRHLKWRGFPLEGEL